MDKTTNRTHIRLINKVLKSTGAQNETRTHTPLPALPPQSSVYTNFTTCAYCARNRGRTCTLLPTLVLETSASANSAIRASTCSISASRILPGISIFTAYQHLDLRMQR